MVMRQQTIAGLMRMGTAAFVRTAHPARHSEIKLRWKLFHERILRVRSFLLASCATNCVFFASVEPLPKENSLSML